MAKRIEIIPATNQHELKEQLEDMVNNGWEIKGVVGYNPHNSYTEPFVILESTVADEYARYQSKYAEDPVADQFIPPPEPPKKDISISVGG
ncbi:MAG TPA: hypothetical protein VHO90_05475 [Bacteroidales bacterium]|jgi:hypothetical protein|nr:hypothetical protein [Bacteroidales bacterium]